jgi:hypothetical protein
MRRTAAVAAGAAFLFSGAAAPAVAVPSGTSVLITAHTDFESDVSAFDATLDGCESGTVVNAENATAHFTPWGGVFNGDKEFTCTGGLSGFTLRLKARFGEGGSTGTWSLVDGWGDLAGLKGSGSLVGVPSTIAGIEIDDVYSGSVR